MATSQELVSTWLVFVAAAAGTIWLGLVIGSLIRPRHPTPEKLRPYECGEEPVGDARVQYDVRIYVAALVFLIFDVEIALLYPAGMILGKINAWRRSELLEEGLAPPIASPSTKEAASAPSDRRRQNLHLGQPDFTPQAGLSRAEEKNRAARDIPLVSPSQVEDSLPRPAPAGSRLVKTDHTPPRGRIAAEGLRQDHWANVVGDSPPLSLLTQVARMIAVEICLFFGILLIGYAYLWRCGDLEWVRPSAALLETPQGDDEENGYPTEKP